MHGADAQAVLELWDKLEFDLKQKRKEGETLKDKGQITTEDTEIDIPLKRAKKERGIEKCRLLKSALT